MTRALTLLLLLAGCAHAGPGQRPDTDYHVRTPQQIAELACELKVHDCRRTIGLALLGTKPCAVYVPPLNEATAHVWRHEEHHCDEGRWHETRMDR